MEIIPLVQRITGLITCIALAVMGFMIYQQLSVDPTGERFVIYFDEAVDGLSKRAKVTYEGYEVGYVELIKPITHAMDPQMAGSTAVVVVIKEAHIEGLGGDVQVRVLKEPLEAEYRHPWVSWVDPDLPPPPIDEETGDPEARVRKLDYVLAVNGVEVCTVAGLMDRIGSILANKTDDPHQVFYTLDVWREGVELTVPIRHRELPFEFSYGGTRATINKNLVTQIGHIALAGGHPHLTSLHGLPTSQPLDLDSLKAQAQIFTVETELASLTRLIKKKLPSILRNIDQVTANLSILSRDLSNQTSTLEDILRNVEELTNPENDIGTVLSEGAKSFESARKSLERIEADLAAGGKIHESLKNLEKLLADGGQVVVTLRSAQELMVTLNEQFEEGSEVHQVLTEARAALGDIRQTVGQVNGYLQEDGEVRALLSKSNETMSDVQKSLSGTGRIGGTLDDVQYTMRNDLRPMLRQLTETMRVLQETMARFNANPNPVISGRAKPED